MFQAKRKFGLRSIRDVGDVAGEQQVAFSGGGEAGEVVDGALGMTVVGLAGRLQLQRLGRLELHAMDAAAIEAGLDLGVVGGAVNLGAHVEGSAPAGVFSEKQPGELSKGRIGPLRFEIQGHLPERRRGAPERALKLQEAGIGEIQVEVGARGLGFKPELPLVGLIEPDRELRVQEREGLLDVAKFEIDARVGGLDVREAGRSAGMALCGGSVGNARSLVEHGADIPLSGGVADQVQAGFVEADAGDFEAAAPQGDEADVGHHAGGMEHGLGPEGGIFADDQLFNFKARAGQQAQLHGAHANGTPDGPADAIGDAVLIAADVDEGRQDGGCHQQQQCDERDPVPGSRRAGVLCARGGHANAPCAEFDSSEFDRRSGSRRG